MMTDASESPAIFSGLVDLARSDLGGVVLACSDDFFAEAGNLVRDEEAVFDPDAYTERGKLMDGWESRRKRVPGHDWCILKLGVAGEIRGVDIDTSHFLGNHPPHASLEACRVPDETTVTALRGETRWTEIVRSMPLRRGSHNIQVVDQVGEWTHVRLRIYPDGGVARLRIWGRPRPEPVTEEEDLASLLRGGRAVACSDMFFSPMNNLLLPHPAPNMGGGWETRRSRPPGMDWIIVRLGSPGRLSRAVVDTLHFKGNFPDSIALDGLYWPDAPIQELIDGVRWTEIAPPFEAHADGTHHVELVDTGPFTHVRMRIYPDGGVSRLRVWGKATVDTPASVDERLHRLNQLGEDERAAAFSRCCGSRRWVRRMVAQGPFSSWEHLHGCARTIWWALDDTDWIEAFSHHPKIGADPEALREKFGATAAWSQDEQAGMQDAGTDVIERLAQGNRDYEARFGYIFIVCASGLGAAEMLDRLEARLPHDPANEIRIAAGQQARITALRLDKLEIS